MKERRETIDEVMMKDEENEDEIRDETEMEESHV